MDADHPTATATRDEPLGGPRFLVVDDFSTMRRVVRGLLKDMGFANVEEADDGVSALARLKSGPFDFVLLDVWKDLYLPCFELVHPKLAPGGIIAADNMLLPEIVRPQAEAYRKRVRAAGDLDSVLLDIGNGIEISRKRS